MFEAITIRQNQISPDTLNIGSIAEALLFYQNVHLAFDYTELFNLVRQIGLEDVSHLLAHPSLKATYIENPPATTTSFQDGVPAHQFGVITLGNPKVGRSKPRKLIAAILSSQESSSRRTRRLVEKCLKRIHILELASQVGTKGGLDLSSQATADLDDAQYVEDLAMMTLREVIPNLEIDPGWYFRVLAKRPKFVIDTNIDFKSINRLYHAIRSEARLIKGFQVIAAGPLARQVEGARTSWFGRTKSEVDEINIDPTILVGAVLETRLNLMLAFNNMTEFLTAPAEAEMMRKRVMQIFQRRDKSVAEMEIFQQLAFPDGRSLKSVMNAGERSISELFELLEKSAKFREWLRGLHPDQKLAAEYLREVAATSWLDRLPPKTLRFAFFTGAGLLADLVLPTGIGTATGVAIGAGDSFLLDKIIKGWKPNQFIDGPMREFVAAPLENS